MKTSSTGGTLGDSFSIRNGVLIHEDRPDAKGERTVSLSREAFINAVSGQKLDGPIDGVDETLPLFWGFFESPLTGFGLVEP